MPTRLCHMLVSRDGLCRAPRATRITGMGFFAEAWKLDGEEALGRELWVDFHGNPISYFLARRQIVPGAAILTEIGWPLEPARFDWLDPTARLVRVLGPSTDPHIAALAAPGAAPPASITFAGSTFIRNREIGWYQGTVDWLGRAVDASITAELAIDIAPATQHLAALLADAARVDALAREAIVAGLYELWRDDWRDDAPLLCASAFAAAMPLASVSLDREGFIELWFDDASFFAGHSVLVQGTSGRGFEPAQIHG